MKITDKLGKEIVFFYDKYINNFLLTALYSCITKLLIDLFLSVVLYLTAERWLFGKLKRQIDKFGGKTA